MFPPKDHGVNEYVVELVATVFLTCLLVFRIFLHVRTAKETGDFVIMTLTNSEPQQLQ